MIMMTTTIPSDATTFTLTVDRSPLIGTERFASIAIWLSLDGGATWGGTFNLVPSQEDLPTIQFSLQMGMVVDGTPPLPGMQAVAWRGGDLPSEQGVPRLVRYSVPDDLPATLTFG